MKHTYSISGMSCNGCVASVKKSLEAHPNISNVEIDLKSSTAMILMDKHIETKDLQSQMDESGLHYSISHGSEKSKEEERVKKKSINNGSGEYYCPMHCEGEKNYAQPGDCPVCGMDLLEIPKAQLAQSQYTCPMHPEVVRDGPGDCPICGMDLVPMKPSESAESKTYKELLKKFKIALIFTIPIFVSAMGDMIPGNPLDAIASPRSWSWIQLVLSLPVLFYAGWMFFERAWKSLKTWNLNMFTLIGIGTGVAWIFSVIGLIYPDIFPDQFKSESGVVHAYFEAATVILTLVLLGQLLEARAHNQTSGAIKKLLELAPNEATRVDANGNDHLVSIHDIIVGDILRVKPGDKVPVDGLVTEGGSNIDESMISGEPLPIAKKVGSDVTSGTINGTRSFLMRAEKVGSDTMLSQIIQMVNNASRSKAPIQKLADKISRYFVPAVMAISIITFIVWYAIGPEPAMVYAFVNAIAVLIIACPCALGLATPMSVMVGVGKGAQNGVLIKSAEALEKLNNIDILITDKTGTITEGKPTVNKVIALQTNDTEPLIGLIASINKSSEHPLAEAIVDFAKSQNISIKDVQNFESVSGMGAKGEVSGILVAIGNAKMMKLENVILSKKILQEVEVEQKQGSTVSYISTDGTLAGYVSISDAIKASSHKAIKALKKRGIEVIMLTGDNANTAAAVANQLGLTDFKADCLPQDKLNYIKKLQAEGKKVAMAGDGINDAPALAQSDVGIAMGTGTDVAIESAEVTLIKGDLYGIEKAVNLGHATMKNIKQNLFFAFAYNVLGIPIAAGVLYPIFGILLSPMIAAAAMSFSSFSVIVNSLRLRKVDLG